MQLLHWVFLPLKRSRYNLVQSDPYPLEVHESDLTGIPMKKAILYLTPGLDRRLGITKDERRYYDRM